MRDKYIKLVYSQCFLYMRNQRNRKVTRNRVFVSAMTSARNENAIIGYFRKTSNLCATFLKDRRGLSCQTLCKNIE